MGYCSDSTFPGFTTGLARASDEAGLLEALEHIRHLTDLDGSIWWWPHKLGCTASWDVVRWPMKCCWAGGVIKGSITNRNTETFEATIELTLPSGSIPDSYRINEEKYSNDLVRFRTRYNRPSYIAVLNLEPGSTQEFEMQFTKQRDIKRTIEE